LGRSPLTFCGQRRRLEDEEGQPKAAGLQPDLAVRASTDSPLRKTVQNCFALPPGISADYSTATAAGAFYYQVLYKYNVLRCIRMDGKSRNTV
jgi:hypothetical protein